MAAAARTKAAAVEDSSFGCQADSIHTSAAAGCTAEAAVPSCFAEAAYQNGLAAAVENSNSVVGNFGFVVENWDFAGSWAGLADFSFEERIAVADYHFQEDTIAAG